MNRCEEGKMKLMEMAGYDTIQASFCRVIDNRMSRYRILEELEKTRMDTMLLRKDKTTLKTYSQLYDEMKQKVLGVA